MNLPKAMAAAGLGCGEGCACARLFTASLEEFQSELLGHLIKKGAKRRLKQVSDALDVETKEDESGTHVNPAGPFADLLRSFIEDLMDPIADAEPYTGDLTDEQVAVLAEIPEDFRERSERRLRQAITAKADNDPSRVTVELVEDGVTYTVISDEDDVSNDLETSRATA